MSRTDFKARRNEMSLVSRIAVALIAVLVLSSCANTIRGAGRDVSNTKDAVKDAAE
jgi:predicted small secreted protein